MTDDLRINQTQFTSDLEAPKVRPRGSLDGEETNVTPTKKLCSSETCKAVLSLIIAVPLACRLQEYPGVPSALPCEWSAVLWSAVPFSERGRMSRREEEVAEEVRSLGARREETRNVTTEIKSVRYRRVIISI